MNNALYYALAWPWIVICSVARFIVWGDDPDKRQTTQQRRPNPGVYWVGRATEAERRFRDLDYKSRREIEELKRKLYDAYKNKKR